MSCPRLIALPPSAHATLHRNDHLNQIRGSFVSFCPNFCIVPQLIERRSPSGRSTQVPQVTGYLCKANVQAVWLVSQAGKAHQRREERRRGERRLGRHAAVHKHRSIQVLVVCITLRSQAPWTLGCRPHSLLSMDRPPLLSRSLYKDSFNTRGYVLQWCVCSAVWWGARSPIDVDST